MPLHTALLRTAPLCAFTSSSLARDRERGGSKSGRYEFVECISYEGREPIRAGSRVARVEIRVPVRRQAVLSSAVQVVISPSHRMDVTVD